VRVSLSADTSARRLSVGRSVGRIDRSNNVADKYGCNLVVKPIVEGFVEGWIMKNYAFGPMPYHEDEVAMLLKAACILTDYTSVQKVSAMIILKASRPEMKLKDLQLDLPDQLLSKYLEPFGKA
jgi:hypothetical protein